MERHTKDTENAQDAHTKLLYISIRIVQTQNTGAVQRITWASADDLKPAGGAFCRTKPEMSRVSTSAHYVLAHQVPAAYHYMTWQINCNLSPGEHVRLGLIAVLLYFWHRATGLQANRTRINNIVVIDVYYRQRKFSWQTSELRIAKYHNNHKAKEQKEREKKLKKSSEKKES